MHLVGDREGLLPECSAGNLELRRLKLKHTWQLTACLLQIINGSLPMGSTISIMTVVLSGRAHQDGKGHAYTALINVRNSAHVMTLVFMHM